MGKRLYVGNLPYSANEQDLHDLFAGTGHEVTRPSWSWIGKVAGPRGFAFVEMATDAGAEAAIANLNGKDFQGRHADCQRGA